MLRVSSGTMPRLQLPKVQRPKGLCTEKMRYMLRESSTQLPMQDNTWKEQAEPNVLTDAARTAIEEMRILDLQSSSSSKMLDTKDVVFSDTLPAINNNNKNPLAASNTSAKKFAVTTN